MSKPEVASLNPADFIQAGLPDDFRGRVIEAVYCRWDYDGAIDEPVLAARLKIESEDFDEPITQHWSAGSLDTFVPSEDGKTPCEEDEVGPFAIRVGKKAQLNNNTNFAHLMSAIIDAGKASGHFTENNLSASLECLVGLDAHWNRVPQKKRSGLNDAAQSSDDKKRSRDVLVVTEVFGYGESKKSGSKTSKPAKQTAKPEPEQNDESVSDLDQVLHEIVLGAVAEGPVKKAQLPALVLKALAADKANKAPGVKRVGETEFLESIPGVTFDAKKGVLTLEE